MVLARELVLLPNNRSCRALSDAFVRRLGTRGLLLPRMAPIGGLDLDEAVGVAFDDLGHARSEEHTSELQSLMRISYAVFCLKKTIQLMPHISCTSSRQRLPHHTAVYP